MTYCLQTVLPFTGKDAAGAAAIGGSTGHENIKPVLDTGKVVFPPTRKGTDCKRCIRAFNSNGEWCHLHKGVVPLPNEVAWMGLINGKKSRFEGEIEFAILFLCSACSFDSIVSPSKTTIAAATNVNTYWMRDNPSHSHRNRIFHLDQKFMGQ